MASKTKTKPRIRLNPDIRRKSIVEAAFKAVAQDGFEGLRTRDIAALVGINSATLHHYFSTKEDLIAAVADHLEKRLRTEKASTADAAFDGQINDVIFYGMERPDILAVYREFVARAPRDPAIRALVARLHGAWRASIVAALKRGKEDGSLRPDLDIEAASGLVLSTTWGFVSQIFAKQDDLIAAAHQLKAWMSAR
jgi:AcrR family transcriptional regulator